MKRNINISAKSAVNHLFAVKAPALLLVLLMLFVAKNDLFASNRNAFHGTGDFSDTLYQPVPVTLTPCSDMLFVVPNETIIAPPTNGGRIVSRNNGASLSSNLKNQSARYASAPLYLILEKRRLGRDFRLNAFGRNIDYYVYFLNILKL